MCRDGSALARKHQLRAEYLPPVPDIWRRARIPRRFRCGAPKPPKELENAWTGKVAGKGFDVLNEACLPMTMESPWLQPAERVESREECPKAVMIGRWYALNSCHIAYPILRDFPTINCQTEGVFTLQSWIFSPRNKSSSL